MNDTQGATIALPTARTGTWRDEILWIAGASISLFGDAALWLAFGVWVKDLTQSNGAAGLAIFAYLLPAVFAPLTGLLADRVRRRTLIIVSDFILAAWVCLAFLVRGPEQVWLIYLLLVGAGFGASLHAAAGSALLTLLVPTERLGRANAILRTVKELGLLAAPAAGAALYVAYGAGLVSVVDALTFLISAACVLLVRVEEPRPAPRNKDLRTELLAGVTHLWRTPPLRDVVLALGGALLAFGFFEPLIFAVVDKGLQRPAAFLGALLSMKGLGSVVGGILSVRLTQKHGERQVTGLGLIFMAAGTALLMLPGLPAAVAGCVVLGVGIPMALIGFYLAVQKNSPNHLQGRVFTAADVLVRVPQVSSIALGAVLVSIIDYRILLGIMVVVVGSGAIFLYSRPRV
jgi:MFS family permease